MSRKKRYYGEDVGLSIQNKMKDLDWEDRHPERHPPHHDPDSAKMPADQEDDDWRERLYER